MRLLKRYCVLLLGLAMALAMSSVVRADAVTDWNAIATQIISNAPCPAAPCANPPVHPGATATLDSAMVQAAVYDAVESITGRFRPYATAPVQTVDYHRFSDVAHDVVNVRIWQGIHFRPADVQGRKQGRHVAQWVFGHFLRSVNDDDRDDGDDEE
jgi:hypothetical protein